jgi:hypothetical protein
MTAALVPPGSPPIAGLRSIEVADARDAVAHALVDVDPDADVDTDRARAAPAGR